MIRYIWTLPSSLENNKATCLKFPRNTCSDCRCQNQYAGKYLRTGAIMCSPEKRNVHGKHNSFV